MRLLLAFVLTLIAGPALAQNPPIPPEVLAAARRPVVMTLPGMDEVQVTKDIRYTPNAPAQIAMDVYRPPGLKAGDRRPAVIFIHGGGPPGAPMKEMGVYTSYGRLIAAQDMVAVTFTHQLGYPKTMIREGAADVATAIAYVRAHAAELNVDPDRICLSAYSAGGPMLAPYIAEAPSWLRCIVAYYPIFEIEDSAVHKAAETPETLAAFSPLRQLGKPGRKAPMFLARAGKDEIPQLLGGLDRFIAEAVKTDYPLTLANNPGAPHSFDITEPTPRTLDILEMTFAFVRRQMG